MAGRKGISIIVAIILAFAITLTLAISLFTFVQTTQRTAQGQTQSEISQLFVRASSSLKITDTPIIGADNTTKLILRNAGFRELDLGENNLNVIVRVPSAGQACSFTLNETNCAACTGNISVGTIKAIDLNNSAISCNEATLSDFFAQNAGFGTDILISDRAASFVTSQSFDITPVTICRLTLDNIFNFTQIHNSTFRAFCTNYSVQNLGNIQDTYDISMIGEGATTFFGVFSSGDCTGSFVPGLDSDNDSFSLTLNPNQITNFSINTTNIASDVWQRVIIDAVSTTCSGVSVSDRYYTCVNDTLLPCTGPGVQPPY